METSSGKAKSESTADPGTPEPVAVVDSWPAPARLVGRTALSGRRLGRYEIDERVGEDWFGDIYSTTVGAGRTAAVMRVRSTAGVDRRCIEGALAEARRVSTLHHPYAASLVDFGHDAQGDVLWIAMEDARGVTLRNLIGQRRVGLPEVVGLVQRIAAAVDAAHERDIVHLALDPGNVVMMSRAGRLVPKVLDFGFRAVAERIPSDAEAEASAPDVSDGRAVDIVALGVLTIELLTGRRPPTDGEFTLEPEAAPSVPSDRRGEVEAALRRSVHRDAARRPGSALEFAGELARAAGLETSAPRVAVLPPGLAERWIAESPEPIAEALARLMEAPTGAPQRESLAVFVRALWHHLGVLALACRPRSRREVPEEQGGVVEHLRKLQTQGIDGRGWFELVRTACRPHGKEPEAFAVPELVTLVASEDMADAWEALRGLDGEVADPQAADEEGDRARFDAVASMLENLTGLLSYRLVVKEGASPRDLSGPRVRVRRAMPVVGEVPDGVPIVVNTDGVRVADLAPWAQFVAPISGAPPRLFYVEGVVDGAARLVSWPERYVLRSEAVFAELVAQGVGIRASVGDVDEDSVVYRGLQAYRTEDASWFFGRDRECDEVRNLLRDEPLVTIVGATGCGKTSLVQAGVLGRSAEAKRPVSLQPGRTPLLSLAAALHEAERGRRPGRDGGSHSTIDQDEGVLRDDPSEFGRRMREMATASSVDVLVVVDRLEEVFTLCSDAEERLAFAEAVMGAVRSSNDRVRVLMTLRADYTARILTLGPFRGRLERSLWTLGTPAPSALRKIAAEPARRAGYRFEDEGLLDELVHGVSTEPDGLTSLSTAVSELWRLREAEGKALTRAAYEAIGGVAGAVSYVADEVLDGQADADLARLELLMPRLVTPEGTGGLVRRLDLLARAEDLSAMQALLERLLSARILATRVAPGDESIELGSEVLLARWERLRRWVEADARSREIQDRLREAARRWQAAGRDTHSLWNASQLAEFSAWSRQRDAELPELEADFIRRSRARQGRARRWERVGIGVALVALAATVGGAWIVRGRAERDVVEAERLARAARDEADAAGRGLIATQQERGREAMVDGRPLAALVHLARAYQLGGRAPATLLTIGLVTRSMERVRHTMRGHEGRVVHLVRSRSGDRIVSIGEDGRAIVWDPQSGQRVATMRGHEAEITAVSFGPSTDKLVTASADGSARVWDAASGRELRRFDHDGPVAGAQFIAAGRRLLTHGADGIAVVWDVTTGDRVREFRPSGEEAVPIVRAVVGPSDRALVTVTGGGAGRLAAWSVETGVARWSAELSSEPRAVVFSPAGGSFVTGGADGSVTAWDVASGNATRLPRSHGASVAGLVFDDAGRRLLVSDDDGGVEIWDVPSRALTGRIVVPGLACVAMTADGTRIVTGGREVLSWNPDGPWAPTSLGWAHTGRVSSVVALPEGRVASASWDGSVKIWGERDPNVIETSRWPEPLAAVDASSAGVMAAGGSSGRLFLHAASGGPSQEVQAHEGGVVSMAFSPSGHRLVTVGRDSAAKVWLANGDKVHALQGAGAPAVAATFLVGDRVVVGRMDGTAQIYSKKGEAGAVLRGHEGPVSVFAVDPRDRYLATGGTDGRISIWGTGRFERAFEFDAHGTPITAAAFSPDGRTLATAGRKRLKLWGVGGEWTLEATSAEGPEGFVDVAFSPDGSLLATAGGREVLVWDAEALVPVLKFALQGPPTGVAFTASGDQIVATVGRSMQVWNVQPTVETAEVIARNVACNVPLALQAERLVPHEVECD